MSNPNPHINPDPQPSLSTPNSGALEVIRKIILQGYEVSNFSLPQAEAIYDLALSMNLTTILSVATTAGEQGLINVSQYEYLIEE
jgi:hypothetical protein